MSADDFWAPLRAATPSRIGQRRSGDTVDTREVLALRAAHARARDAVHVPLDVDALQADLDGVGLGPTLHVRSAAPDRATYLRRPDLGRRPADDTAWPDVATDRGADLGVVLADGLSTTAVARHGAAMLTALVDVLGGRLALAPPVVATQARVAIGDEIGARLGWTTVLVLVGERPGLSVDDSLGIYLTHHPRPGRRDAERNCLSNVRPGGLELTAAARTVAALVDGARTLGESGVRLKDTSTALR